MTLLITTLSWAQTDPLARKAPPSWQISSSASYTSGDYGTNIRTTSIYVPFTLKRFFSDGSIAVTVPWVSIRSDGGITFVGEGGHGQNRRQRGKGSGSSGSGSGSSGSGSDDDGDGDVDDDDNIPGIQSKKTTRSGLGDVTLSGRYYVLNEQDYLPSIAGTGFVKFPTANENKGLGTGEFDGGFGIELSKSLTRDLILYLDGGYAILGEPPGTQLNNPWRYDAGLGYYITDSLVISAFYEESRAIAAASPNPRDIFGSLNYTISPMFRIYASGLAGLSNGAPDYSASGGISIRF